MQKKHGKRFYFVIVLIVFLILFGVAFILKTYRDYVDSFHELQDANQLQLAQSVDRNIDSLLTQCRSSLEYMIATDGFREAEQQWTGQGDNSRLFQLLTENSLKQHELIADVLLLENGDFVSINGSRSFHFLNEDTGNPQRICLGSDDSIYLALICESKGGIRYASLIDLPYLYRKISSTELLQADQLILLDQNRSVLLHFCTDSQTVKHTLVETCPKRQDFQLLLSAEEKQKQSCSSFLYQTQKMDRGYHANIIILPSGISENESFAIGLISNMDKALQPLQSASLYWILGGMGILLGISLLLFLLIYYQRRNEDGIRELELLRNKNRYMEELNQKTQEIAHHQRLEMIGTLTSGIAHEFNNLLTPIMGYSMMTLEQLSPEQEELYDNILEIYHSSRKAKEITSQLSQYSRKSNTEEKKMLNPELLLRKVLRVALPACPAAVTVSILPAELKGSIYGNETQLSQLFLNLMINAFHSMGEQGGKLVISFTARQGQLLIALQDSGCGIPESVLPHIFEPFFTTKEGGKGSGLGLAIVQQIAEDHQGSIEVTSVEGEGSTFTVTLPLYYHQEKI